MPLVLYIVNEAKRTGAPRSAIEILRVLGDLGWERHVLLLAPGPLEGELRSVAETLTRDRGLGRLLRRFRWHGRRLGIHYELCQARRRLVGTHADAVIGDTIVTLPFVLAGLHANIPSALVVRDRPNVVDNFLSLYDRDLSVARAVLAVNSAATGDAVISRTNVDPADIVIVPPVIDVDHIRETAELARQGRPPGDPLRVVALGKVGMSKGTDLFLQTAQQVLAVRRDVEFVWLGERRRVRHFSRIVRREGLTGHVWFPGPTDDPGSWLGRSDAVLVTSREEALSRVAIEALAANLPVVAFDVGGVGEALGAMGHRVPIHDVDVMANTLIRVLDRSADREEGAERLRQARTYDRAVLPAHVQQLVSRLISPTE